MKKSICYSLAFLFVVSLAACGRSAGGKNEKIVFPAGLERIEGTGESHPDLSVPAIRLVVYIDSTECSNCRINNLDKYSPYISLADLYPGFETVVVIWPNSETAETIDNLLAHKEFPFDVFVDRDGTFLEENPSLPATGRNQHVLLTGSDGSTVLTGDPVTSPGRDRQLRNALYGMYKGN